MTGNVDQLLQRSLYVYDIPEELLSSLQLKDVANLPESVETDQAEQRALNAHEDAGAQVTGKSLTSCNLCDTQFSNVADQRSHVRSDWHGYNLKQKLRGAKILKEQDFERLVADLDESISGSESSSSEDEGAEGTKDSTLQALLKKQARLHDVEEDAGAAILRKPKRGAGKPPLIWFSTPTLPANTSLGVYRALFTENEQKPEVVTTTLRAKQLKRASNKPVHNGTGGPQADKHPAGPSIFLCMIGGGHFAGMIVSLTPKVNKNAKGLDERQAIVIAHKTFHRYTTRRKQGGSQSANDSSKGAAHSAGAGIRRYNEAALESEVRVLLGEWKSLIEECQLLFVRATGTTNRRTLFGPYEGQVLRTNDPRNRTFPFSTRRATQSELMRAFVEITKIKVCQVDEAALAAAAAEEERQNTVSGKAVSSPAKPVTPKLSKEEEENLLHTSQLQALIKRSKAPAVLQYLSKYSVPGDFRFYPPSTQAHRHASTPLHLAASTNAPAVVTALLTKAGCDPSILNGEGKPAFEVAGDRQTRDAFRIARSELGETRWDWTTAQVPPPMSRLEAEEREGIARREAEIAEAQRRKIETERLRKEAESESMGPNRKGLSKSLQITGAEKREQEARGLTPEMRMKLERERRARAAEERFKKMAGSNG
ncbi:hypothetical protein MMC25_003567 [Agyrium rufum]|nr:hypothetical protein [Agyrium rufum]